VDGADNFVKIQIAENMAQAFQNINGYLPGDMTITMLSTNFMNSVRSVMSGGTSGMGSIDPSLAREKLGGN